MCYSIYFSSTASDLACHQPGSFSVLPLESDVVVPLRFANRYFLSCRFGGCSCHFRHAHEELGFGLPEDWFQEDEANFAPTAAFYQFLRGVLDAGYPVDLIDVWSDTDPVALETRRVRMSEVSEQEFRFLEGAHLIFER